MTEMEAFDWCRQHMAGIRFGTRGCASVLLPKYPTGPFIGQSFVDAVRMARQAVDAPHIAAELKAVIDETIAP